jgi:hypothetical protein
LPAGLLGINFPNISQRFSQNCTITSLGLYKKDQMTLFFVSSGEKTLKCQKIMSLLVGIPGGIKFAEKSRILFKGR